MPDDLLDLLGDRRVEEYLFNVRDQRFIIRFQPLIFFEEYDTDALFQLTGKRVFEVSFANLTTANDGGLIADYGTTGKGSQFQILGSVASGILDWARKRRPDFLYWWAIGRSRQRTYSKMLLYFAARGKQCRRLTNDPFTGQRCCPEAFWVSV